MSPGPASVISVANETRLHSYTSRSRANSADRSAARASRRRGSAGDIRNAPHTFPRAYTAGAADSAGRSHNNNSNSSLNTTGFLGFTRRLRRAGSVEEQHRPSRRPRSVGSSRTSSPLFGEPAVTNATTHANTNRSPLTAILATFTGSGNSNNDRSRGRRSRFNRNDPSSTTPPPSSIRSRSVPRLVPRSASGSISDDDQSVYLPQTNTDLSIIEALLAQYEFDDELSLSTRAENLHNQERFSENENLLRRAIQEGFDAQSVTNALLDLRSELDQERATRGDERIGWREAIMMDVVECEDGQGVITYEALRHRLESMRATGYARAMRPDGDMSPLRGRSGRVEIPLTRSDTRGEAVFALPQVALRHQKQQKHMRPMMDAGILPESYPGVPMLCRVCFSMPIDSVLVECGHVGLCGGCANECIAINGKCPFCRVNISQVVKMFPV